jgi:gamma-glutamylcyclotransferase (GGCT)/AIG2-like uncharacterized protein YtfP
MTSAGQDLFVYGTLRQAGGHAMAQFLASQARRIGPGKVRGRLYDLGSYPGLVEARAENEWVHGEIYELPQPAETLAVLDRYEGCGPEDRPPLLFERWAAPVVLPTGEVRSCWVYFYKGQVREDQWIVSGDYADAGQQARFPK